MGNVTAARTAHSHPRLIEFTGERCVPWASDYQMVYEHLHRYHFASRLCAGKRVLDLASGEGYGSAILGRSATHVTGIDIDPASVQHARLHHGTDSIDFLEGSMLDPTAVGERTFDVVVCFEALEHVDDHAALLEVVSGALHQGGIFIVSTPDRSIYSHDYRNPFHIHELDKAEFQALLSERFANVALYGQTVVTGSVMQAMQGVQRPRGDLIAVASEDQQWPRRHDIAFPYLVAVASNEDIAELPDVSTLVDTDLLLAAPAPEAVRLSHDQQAKVERLELQVEHLEDTVRSLASRGEELRVTLAAQEQQLRRITTSKAWQALLMLRRGVQAARRLGS